MFQRFIARFRATSLGVTLLSLTTMFVSGCHSRFPVAVPASPAVQPPAVRVEIVGRAIDLETARPLGVATALIQGRQEQVVTDSLGRFTLNAELPAGNYLFQLSRVGYMRAQVQIALTQSGKLDLFDIPQRNQYPSTYPQQLPEPRGCRIVRTAPASVAANEEVREAHDSTGTRWHICVW